MIPEILEHRIAAEKALGKPLPAGAVVHHFDRDRSNDKNNNLVICENRAYHHFIHVRQRAKEAGVNLRWRKCGKCKEYDAVENLIFRYPALIHLDCKQVLISKNRNKITLNLLKKSITSNLIVNRSKERFSAPISLQPSLIDLALIY